MPHTVTEKQLKHMLDIGSEFAAWMTRKYTLGAMEHGGDIRDYHPITLIEMAMDECIDQYVYLSTLRKKLLDEMAKTLSKGSGPTYRNQTVRITEDSEI